jgi:hypothetical protein
MVKYDRVSAYYDVITNCNVWTYYCIEADKYIITRCDIQQTIVIGRRNILNRHS